MTNSNAAFNWSRQPHPQLPAVWPSFLGSMPQESSSSLPTGWTTSVYSCYSQWPREPRVTLQIHEVHPPPSVHCYVCPQHRNNSCKVFPRVVIHFADDDVVEEGQVQRSSVAGNTAALPSSFFGLHTFAFYEGCIHWKSLWFSFVCVE